MTRRNQETASDVHAEALKAARAAGYRAALNDVREEMWRMPVAPSESLFWRGCRAWLETRIDRLEMDLEKR